MLPDHGREIDKYEFSNLDKLALHCERASDMVSKWPAWKKNLLGNSPTRRTPRLVLPPSDYFYDRAMKRSAEIKARSAAEIMQEAGVPNMLESRTLKFNCQGAATGRTSCSTPVNEGQFEARFKALQERYAELERKLSEREAKTKVPNRLEGRQLYGPCRGCQQSGTACHVCKYGGP